MPLTQQTALDIASHAANEHILRLRRTNGDSVPATAEFFNECAYVGLCALEQVEPGRWRVLADMDEWRAPRIVVEMVPPLPVVGPEGVAKPIINTTTSTSATQTRLALGDAIAVALRLGEEFMREAEAQHAKISSLNRRASLSEVTLSHRALALLRPLAEMLPAAPEDTQPVLPTAHRVANPPALGWSRAPEEVMGGTVGGLARALHTMARCLEFDLHVNDDGRSMLLVDRTTSIHAAREALKAVFGDVVGRNAVMRYLP